MAEKPQQQTLSVRISDALRRRLERARQLTASKTGESVSTSEIAKQLLESAREDRLDVVNLLSDPTETLLQIRRKGEAQHPLSLAEWTVLAHFVHEGTEAFSAITPSTVSRESLIGVLDAFLAVYDLRGDRSPEHDMYYLGNLPGECRPATGKRSAETNTADVVRRTVIETRRRMEDPATTMTPVFAGRNLYRVLELSTAAGADAVNRALRSSWPVLWRLAARGHYALTRTPVREKETPPPGRSDPPISPLAEGGYVLSFQYTQGQEFSVLLSFPGERGPMYPISGYPKLAEFRAMLAALTSTRERRRWSGAYFFGYVQTPPVTPADQAWFGANDNGITFGFSPEEWAAVQALFRRAWDLPAIHMAWETLALEYGEL
jgi:hypothetical protein